ncbi:MAG: hypothetical protein WDZ66_03935 [Steroidobacteraceae bacterium]
MTRTHGSPGAATRSPSWRSDARLPLPSLEHRELVALIKHMAAMDRTEAEIAAVTGLGKIDVRRALAERSEQALP